MLLFTWMQKQRTGGDVSHGKNRRNRTSGMYAASPEAKGIPASHIRKYGFAFEDKKVLIG